MINRNVHARSAGDDTFAAESGYSPDLSTPPEAYLPPDPGDNSTAMLGEPNMQDPAVSPSEAGPTGQSLAALGMIVQGAQILSLHIPGFVPMEVTAWVQQAMQVLPQLLQQMQSGLAAAGSGMLPGAGMAQTGGIGPMAGPPSPVPSGPPQASRQASAPY